jgi:hypothetical protein
MTGRMTNWDVWMERTTTTDRLRILYKIRRCAHRQKPIELVPLMLSSIDEKPPNCRPCPVIIHVLRPKTTELSSLSCYHPCTYRRKITELHISNNLLSQEYFYNNSIKFLAKVFLEVFITWKRSNVTYFGCQLTPKS